LWSVHEMESHQDAWLWIIGFDLIATGRGTDRAQILEFIALRQDQQQLFAHRHRLPTLGAVEQAMTLPPPTPTPTPTPLPTPSAGGGGGGCSLSGSGPNTTSSVFGILTLFVPLILVRLRRFVVSHLSLDCRRFVNRPYQ